jgi:hypothetical protein
MSSSDPEQLGQQRRWRSGRLVLAQSGLVPPSVSSDLNDALAVMDREGRTSPLRHALRAKYMLLGLSASPRGPRPRQRRGAGTRASRRGLGARRQLTRERR